MSRDGYKDTTRNPATGRRLETRDADYRITGNVDVVGDLTRRGSPAVPVKATGAEADTGTDDAKFLTPKAVNDSHNVPSVPPGADGNVLTSDGTDWVSAGGGGVTNSAADKRFAISDGTNLNGGSDIINAELDTVTQTIILRAPVGVTIDGGDSLGSISNHPTLWFTSETADDAFIRVAKSNNGIERHLNIVMDTPDTGVGSNISIEAGAGAVGDNNGGGLILAGGIPTGTGTGGGVDIGGGGAIDVEQTGDGGEVYIHGGLPGTGGEQGAILLDTISQVQIGDVNTGGNGTLLTVDDAAEVISSSKVFKLTPMAFADLPVGAEGMMTWVNDSSTATWGATIAGGGVNKVLAVYNGTNWTCAGK